MSELTPEQEARLAAIRERNEQLQREREAAAIEYGSVPPSQIRIQQQAHQQYLAQGGTLSYGEYMRQYAETGRLPSPPRRSWWGRLFG